MTDQAPAEIPLRVKIVKGEHVPTHPDECEPHTPSPGGYLAWDAWAEEKTKTHVQRQCRGCGLYVVWEPKPDAASEPVTREFDPDWTIPPGVLLRRVLAAKGLAESDLSDAGLLPETIAGILAGTSVITEDCAAAIERATGVEAGFWMRAELGYRQDLAAGKTATLNAVTHLCPPDGTQVTPCCDQTPFDLPRTDRITEDPSLVTCRATETEATESKGEQVSDDPTTQGGDGIGPEIPGPEISGRAGQFLVRVDYSNRSFGNLMPAIHADGTWTFTAAEGMSTVERVHVRPGQTVRGKIRPLS